MQVHNPDRDNLNWTVPPDVIDLKPVAVLVLAGTNNLACGVPVSIIENNLAMMAGLADHNRSNLFLLRCRRSATITKM